MRDEAGDDRGRTHRFRAREHDEADGEGGYPDERFRVRRADEEPEA
jgi:hypothetical protein